MKKIALYVICLGTLNFSATASSYFYAAASTTKNIVFAVGRGLKHFYFPDFGNPYEETLSEDSNPLATPSLAEASDSEQFYLYWARKDLHNKRQYWNKNSLRRWANQSYKEGQIPVEDNYYSFESESDEEIEWATTKLKKSFRPIKEKIESPRITFKSSTRIKSDKITFFSI